jgi:hypothetical protein
MKQRPKSRENDLVIQELSDEILVYDLKSHRALCLNEASALVWKACDGKNSVSKIAQVVSAKLKSEVNEDFVWVALDGLKREKLISNAADVTSPFYGLSRREVIKKIGFSSMVALPMVSSLVAPSAIHAQSIVGPTCSSGNPGECSCMGSLPIGSICATFDCASPCNACLVTAACMAPEPGLPQICPGVCFVQAPITVPL